uniref:ZPT2-8 n=1 Tax=Petunia hybrida TaxID=4102 RepID=O22088_PETHY|nr:ZPT2-8 [Petunia x hybrida]
MTIKKRSREELAKVETLAMANCVNILEKNTSLARKIFECKTCKKQFDSFQALGGHRASHKKPRFITAADFSIGSPNYKPNNKVHECSFCGEDFPTGQALGGHMRKHRDKLGHELKKQKQKNCDEIVEIEKKNNSGTGKLFFDLNLTPYENDLMLGIIPLKVFI